MPHLELIAFISGIILVLLLSIMLSIESSTWQRLVIAVTSFWIIFIWLSLGKAMEMSVKLLTN